MFTVEETAYWVLLGVEDEVLVVGVLHREFSDAFEVWLGSAGCARRHHSFVVAENKIYHCVSVTFKLLFWVDVLF